jgi:hypothetical protein
MAKAKKWEFKAFLTVEADTEEEATAAASAACDFIDGYRTDQGGSVEAVLDDYVIDIDDEDEEEEY